MHFKIAYHCNIIHNYTYCYIYYCKYTVCGLCTMYMYVFGVEGIIIRTYAQLKHSLSKALNIMYLLLWLCLPLGRLKTASMHTICVVYVCVLHDSLIGT